MEYHTATDRRCKTSELERAILAALAERGVPIVPQVKRRSWVFAAGVQGAKILVEVDGAYWHSLPHAVERDARKDAWAAQHGYTIVRVAEAAYREDPEGVITATIAAIVAAQADAGSDRSDTEGYVPSVVFDDWRDAFIARLGDTGNVRAACIAARISRSNAYHRRDTDEEFRLAWDEAAESFCDLLEGVYAQRGIEQSDRAIEGYLKAYRRERWGDKSRVELTGKDGGAIQVDSAAMQAAAEELAAWRTDQMSALSSWLNSPPTPPTPATTTES